MALHVNNWGEAENGPRPTPDPRISAVIPAMGVTQRMAIRCTPEACWDLITSVERIGEFSPECAEAWWVDGFPAGALGGRFEGRNRIQAQDDTYEWTRPCDVVAYDPPSHFAYTVGDRFDGTPATRWTFRISRSDAGCMVEQQFEHLPDGLSGIRLQAELVGQGEQVAELISRRRDALGIGMTRTLERMRHALESPSPSPSPPASP